MAMGTEVVPTLNLLRKGTIPGYMYPVTTPAAIDRNIHNVRKRSRKERRFVTPSGIRVCVFFVTIALYEMFTFV